MSDKQEKQVRERRPGVCVPWEEKRAEWGDLPGDEGIVKRVWEETDSLGHLYIWHLLLSF